MTNFYRFIIALLSLALVLSLLKRDKQEAKTASEPTPKTYVSRFGNAVSHKSLKQLADEAQELLEDSDNARVNRASEKLSKGA